jgi:pyroglutamyl-peptidase
MRTILVTGFGPFPGAPFNPTGALARRLARERLPGADVKVVPHIFRTSYAAVDRELPFLLREYRPDAILMFGLAARTPYLRIETSARNVLAGAADADRRTPRSRVIDRSQPAKIAARTPARRLLASARAAHVPAALSRDAGRYLCNYLCWRATEAINGEKGPHLAAFVHVPSVRRVARPARNGTRPPMTMIDLTRAGRGFLRVMASLARR